MAGTWIPLTPWSMNCDAVHAVLPLRPGRTLQLAVQSARDPTAPCAPAALGPVTDAGSVTFHSNPGGEGQWSRAGVLLGSPEGEACDVTDVQVRLIGERG